jgi:hypothetical protein
MRFNPSKMSNLTAGKRRRSEAYKRRGLPRFSLSFLFSSVSEVEEVVASRIEPQVKATMSRDGDSSLHFLLYCTKYILLNLGASARAWA